MAKAAKKAPSKSEILSNIATVVGLNKKDVANVLDALSNEIKKNLSARGPGIFAIPGLVKIERRRSPHGLPRRTFSTPSRRNCKIGPPNRLRSR